jgi:alkylation response protein AidB-like acyl-CoA dehydrogenase
MDFALPDSVAQLQRTVRDFCEAEVKAQAREWDRRSEFPRDTVRKLGELGLLGLTVPEELGGSALDALSVATVVETVASYDGSLALTVASHNGLCIGHLKLFGSEAQKQRYLPQLASGEKLGAWGLTEPGSGSDAGSLRTVAVRRGDGWVINGSKTFITQGSVGDVFVVLASTDAGKRQKGITAFVLEKGVPGFSQRALHGKLGMRSSDTAELSFENVAVSDEARVGQLNHGFIDTLSILDRGRISIAALALGLGSGALREAARYAKDRSAFGGPIARFQALQWMLADSATELTAARLLIWRAARRCDAGLPFGKEASMAKLAAAQAGMRACERAVQIHGGYGYTDEFPVERYLRDAKLCEIGEGTNEVQRLVISREILKA